MKLLITALIILAFAGCKLPARELQKEAEAFLRENSSISDSVKVNDRHIHYVKYGDPKSQAVVFVHGSPGSWQGWVRFLKDPELYSNFYLIAIDRPGFGESDAGQSETSINKQAEDLFAVIAKENLIDPILVGHSLGGPVIARMSMNHPYKFGGLVFVAASVAPELEETKWFQYPATWFGIKQIIPSELRVCNEEILALKDSLIEMLPLWKYVTAPSIIIHGEQDDLVPIANKDFLIKHLNPNVIKDVTVDPSLNHFIPWRKPNLIKEALMKLRKKY